MRYCQQTKAMRDMKRDGKQQPKVVEVRVFFAGDLIAEGQIAGQLVEMEPGK